jgi:hypothetical protein
MKNDITPREMATFENGNFWVVYGRNSSGKTHFIGTFPKLLVVTFKDQGLNTLKGIPGAKYIVWDDTPEALIEFCQIYKDSPFETIAFDTFGVYQEDVIAMIKSTLKKRKMEIQMWGDLGDYLSNVLMAMKELSKDKNVIVSFHEQPETIEGYENEITPNVSVAVYGNVIKKTLYGIANYVVHTFIYDYVDPATLKSQYYYASHVGVNPYYWTKFQSEYSVPELVFNPSYQEMIKIKNGTFGTQ